MGSPVSSFLAEAVMQDLERQAKPVREVNKDLRPISLTPILSKVAEDYVVNLFIKNNI